jgi:hypothetical protein
VEVFGQVGCEALLEGLQPGPGDVGLHVTKPIVQHDQGSADLVQAGFCGGLGERLKLADQASQLRPHVGRLRKCVRDR